MQVGGRRRYTPLLLYIIGLNVLVIAAVAVLHELGHATVGHLIGCGNIRIMLLNGGYAPHTVMTCSPANEPGAGLMLLGAALFVLPLALLFHAQRGLKEQFIAHIVLGVGIIAAAHDMQLVAGTAGVGVDMMTAATGVVIALYGEHRLVHGIITTEMPPTRREF